MVKQLLNSSAGIYPSTESGKEMKPSCPLTSRNTLAYSGHNKDLSFSLSLFSEPPFCLEAP